MKRETFLKPCFPFLAFEERAVFVVLRACEKCEDDFQEWPCGTKTHPTRSGVCHEAGWPGHSESFEGIFESAIDEVGVDSVVEMSR
jgi:hypothetical protein